MDNNFIKVARDNFETLVINANSVNIRRAEFGFVNTNCDFIKSMLGNICVHALDNPDIFNDEQSNNIINLINILSNE